MSVLLAAAFALALITLLGLSSASAATVSMSSLQSGDLIRGESLSAVYYYGADGMRYVFPNSKTYFTWYENFDDVKWISDADLGTIQIGGNVTYKPGARMIKINSDPKVYAVGSNGALHWVATEAVATSLYGATWNKQIDDVPDGFFSNYSSGFDLVSTALYNKNAMLATASINADKGLQSAVVFSMTDSGYGSVDVTINEGRAIKFLNNGSNKHTATADDLSWGTGTVTAGGNFTRYFEEAGTYTFFDSYNSQYTGAVIVE